MKKKTLIWAVILAAAAAVSAGVYLLRDGGDGAFACIYVDGELYDAVDLSAAAVPYEMTVETEYGCNVLRVSRGAVEVVRADCDEQVCVNQGSITDGLVPIVCLPHHLVIQIEEALP